MQAPLQSLLLLLLLLVLLLLVCLHAQQLPDPYLKR
jgi:hypothetical protein